MRTCDSQGAGRKVENIFEVIYRRCPRPLATPKSGRFFGGYARPHTGPLVTLGRPRVGVARCGRRRVAALIPFCAGLVRLTFSKQKGWEMV